MGIGIFIQLLHELGINTVGSKPSHNDIFYELDALTTLALPLIMNRIRPYIFEVISEGNNMISVKLMTGDFIKKLNIFFVDSIKWGKMFYLLPRDKVLKIKLYLINNRLPYNISQYGFFENGKINSEIRTYEQMKNKIGV